MRNPYEIVLKRRIVLTASMFQECELGGRLREEKVAGV